MQKTNLFYHFINTEKGTDKLSKCIATNCVLFLSKYKSTGMWG